MPSATERAIRREVTRLAQLDDDSLAAVLDGLNPATRARVSGLLMEYRPAKPEQGSSDKSNMVSALSPWLESRMLGGGTAVTAAVRGVLVDCARRQAGVTATQISKSESRSLFQQLLRPRDKGRRS